VLIHREINSKVGREVFQFPRWRKKRYNAALKESTVKQRGGKKVAYRSHRKGGESIHKEKRETT